MADKTHTKKRQKILLGVLGTVVVIALVVFFVDFGGGSSAPDQVATSTTQTTIPNLDFSLIESETFRQFDVWSVVPVTAGETGKENPFGQ